MKLIIMINLYFSVMMLFMKNPLMLCFNLFIQSIMLFMLISILKLSSLLIMIIVMLYSSNFLIIYMYITMLSINNKFFMKMNTINAVFLMSSYIYMNELINYSWMIQISFMKILEKPYMKFLLIIFILMMMMIMINFMLKKIHSPMRKK